MPLNDFLERYRTPLGEFKEGDQRITAFYNQNSVLYLVNRMPETQKQAVRFYLDCGDDDHLYKGNSLLHTYMRDLNIPHEYRVRNGGHVWEYWRSGLPNALEFLSEGFK
jgi:enterochelin esterase-like enzyme